MSLSNASTEEPLQTIRFSSPSELESIKQKCDELGITPSELFSMHDGSFNSRPLPDQLRFYAARDLGDFFRRKYEASRKKRDLLRKTEIEETNEQYQEFLKRKGRKGNVTFSEKNIDETSRKRAGFDDNSIRSSRSSRNSWVSNVSRASYLGESILDCEGSIEEPEDEPPPNPEEEEIEFTVSDMTSMDMGYSHDSSYEFDADFSFDTIDGTKFRPHHKLTSTQRRNEAGRKAMFRNSDYENMPWASLSGMVKTDYDSMKIERQGYCDEGYRSISGGGRRLNDKYWQAYQSQVESESEMYEDDEDDDFGSCPFQPSKFIPH